MACCTRSSSHTAAACCGCTNIPRPAGGAQEAAVEPFLKTDRLSDTERAMLMGGATAKAYGWSRKRG
jgi:hypothetical protein